MTLNHERIISLITESRRAYTILVSFQTLTLEQFLQDNATIERVRYNFIMLIQSCIDIANHIAARKGNRAPLAYADSFKILEEIGIIMPNISKHMQRMAGLRNVLVHLYWHVDNEKIYNSLQNDLKPIEDFLSIVSHLE